MKKSMNNYLMPNLYVSVHSRQIQLLDGQGLPSKLPKMRAQSNRKDHLKSVKHFNAQ